LSIRFQADNDLQFAIVKAVRRREPSIDFASAQESGLEGLSLCWLYAAIVPLTSISWQ